MAAFEGQQKHTTPPKATAADQFNPLNRRQRRKRRSFRPDFCLLLATRCSLLRLRLRRAVSGTRSVPIQGTDYISARSPLLSSDRGPGDHRGAWQRIEDSVCNA